MPNVFPGVGPAGTSPASYGGTDTSSYRRMIHDYDDNSYRAYSKSSVKHRLISLTFAAISKTRRDAIETFFNANWNLEFYIFLWPEATAVDPTGVSTTGRHLARFGPDPQLQFTNVASCTYSATIEITLLS